MLHNNRCRNATPIIGEDCVVLPLVTEDGDSPEHLQLNGSGIVQRQTIVNILQWLVTHSDIKGVPSFGFCGSVPAIKMLK